jgi:hypothetical protein
MRERSIILPSRLFSYTLKSFISLQPPNFVSYTSKVKLSRYTMQARVREEIQLIIILDLGTRWRGVFSVTPRPRLTPRNRASWYSLHRRLGGPQSRSQCRGHRKNTSPLPRIDSFLHWLTSIFCDHLTETKQYSLISNSIPSCVRTLHKTCYEFWIVPPCKDASHISNNWIFRTEKYFLF